MYSIVPPGTTKAPEPYKVGKKMTDYLLEIYNLNKSEVISVDIISNQDFTEVMHLDIQLVYFCFPILHCMMLILGDHFFEVLCNKIQVRCGFLSLLTSIVLVVDDFLLG